jgi:hypothetical protein
MHAILWMAAALPVIVGQLSTGPRAHMTVTNTASQPVTAWAFAIITHPDPGRTRREVETIDGYLSEATHGIQGSTERLERLMPQQSRVIQLDSLPEDATVEVVAVVLDDGTAVGEESAIAPIFERRARERDALGAVVAVFSDVLASQHGTAALEALKQRLVALPARDEAPCRAAIDAVETYRQRGGARTPDQIDESLRMYAAFVTREYELAKKHSQRKAA